MHLLTLGSRFLKFRRTIFIFGHSIASLLLIWVSWGIAQFLFVVVSSLEAQIVEISNTKDVCATATQVISIKPGLQRSSILRVPLHVSGGLGIVV